MGPGFDVHAFDPSAKAWSIWSSPIAVKRLLDFDHMSPSETANDTVFACPVIATKAATCSTSWQGQPTDSGQTSTGL